MDVILLRIADQALEGLLELVDAFVMAFIKCINKDRYLLVEDFDKFQKGVLQSEHPS